jgi:L-lysine 2,3-aminomutase
MVVSNTSLNDIRSAALAPAAPDWQAVLADAVRDPAELCRLLGLDPAIAAAAEGGAKGFPLLVPRTFLARIRPGDPHDPLLRQVMPQPEELAQVPGFQADPLGEADAAHAPGLLWKYRARLLIVTTEACGVHCRFCFRRHFLRCGGSGGHCPGAADAEAKSLPLQGMGRDAVGSRLEDALAMVEAEPSIEEVILSGGGPLTLGDSQLAQFCGKLAAIPHVKRVRVHTRLPILIPQRVTSDLVGWLRGTRLTPIVVVHVNHPAELVPLPCSVDMLGATAGLSSSAENTVGQANRGTRHFRSIGALDAGAGAALGRLVDAGVPVLSQTVLLAGVNDNPAVLAELFRRLVDLRVMPYYLHQLDRVAGAAHFEVSESRGRELLRRLRAMLPGYAVPRYVRDTRGGTGKELLA